MGRQDHLKNVIRTCRCAKCGRNDALEIHHIIARVDGGSDAASNLIELCAPCHKDWHAFDQAMSMTFAMWLQVPPGYYLAAGCILGQSMDDVISYWRAKMASRDKARADRRETLGTPQELYRYIFRSDLIERLKLRNFPLHDLHSFDYERLRQELRNVGIFNKETHQRYYRKLESLRSEHAGRN